MTKKQIENMKMALTAAFNVDGKYGVDHYLEMRKWLMKARDMFIITEKQEERAERELYKHAMECLNKVEGKAA